MRKLMKGCLGVATAIVAVHFALADVHAGVFSECSPCEVVSCDPCEPCNPCDAVCGKKSQWNFGGWVEAGVYVNSWGQTDRYAGGQLVAPGNSNLLSNVRQASFQMNQLWLFAERELDTRRGFDVGGRVDFLFGTDGYFSQSDGLEFRSGTPNATRWREGDYYSSFAQIYAEVGVHDVSVKAGKFLTPFGHESFMSPERFFYSLSYAFGQLPVTHTGVLATWAPSDKFSLMGGWVNGADKTFYDQDDNAAVFGATLKPNKKISLSYVGGIGRENSSWHYAGLNGNWGLMAPGAIWGAPPIPTTWIPVPLGGTWTYIDPTTFSSTRDYFIQSLVLNVKPNKRWDYTFEWTLKNSVNGNLDIDPPLGVHVPVYTGPPPTLNDYFLGGVASIPILRYDGAYGINQELIYRLNKKWAIGGRFEWMHTYGRVYEVLSGTALGNAIRFDRDFYGYTVAVNWTPTQWLLVRPEVRYDKVYGGVEPFNAQPGRDAHTDQISGGVSAVVKF